MSKKIRFLILGIILLLALIIFVFFYLNKLKLDKKTAGLSVPAINKSSITSGSSDSNKNTTVSNVPDITMTDNNDKTENEIIDESGPFEMLSADDYYAQNSEVINKIKVADSEFIQSEEQVHTSLTESGFVDFPITSEFAMNGEFFESYEISDSSEVKHPIYETFYVTESDDIWTIMVVNDSITALPVSYNMESNRNVEVIVSEKETIFGYDNVSNQFYEIIPNESEFMVIVVDKIDAATLEELTVEVIDAL